MARILSVIWSRNGGSGQIKLTFVPDYLGLRLLPIRARGLSSRPWICHFIRSTIAVPGCRISRTYSNPGLSLAMLILNITVLYRYELG
jgi:hypothetical protein